VDLLNRILEAELAGEVRYTHYSFLVFGHSRIPIVSWLREQAAESLTHAQQAGEMTTLLGEYPSLAIGPLLDTHSTDIGAIMRESLETEGKALALYQAPATDPRALFPRGFLPEGRPAAEPRLAPCQVRALAPVPASPRVSTVCEHHQTE